MLESASTLGSEVLNVLLLKALSLSSQFHDFEHLGLATVSKLEQITCKC